MKTTILFLFTSFLSFSQSIIPYGSIWTYSAPASAPPSNWNTSAFSASTWSDGAGQLGFGDNDEATTYPQSVSGTNVITAYFRKYFTLTSPLSLTVNMIVDDGSVVYINGVEVNRNNMPSGTISYSTLAPVFTSDNRLEVFTIPASYFVAGSNLIAVEVHQESASSSDMSFDLQLFQSSSTECSTVSTLAGSGAITSNDGTGSAASFYAPSGVCSDTYGNIYVADRFGHKIRKITPAGVVTTFAGSGSPASIDGTGTAAGFGDPAGICIDGSGNLYVADWVNNIRKITPSGVVTTIAGSTATGSADGIGAAATFDHPSAIILDLSGNLIVADRGNQKIRKITPSGVVTTLAGSGTAGYADGTGTSASFFAPNGLCIDPSGNIYVAAMHNHCIRKITPAGVVSTFAGSNSATGSTDGIGTAATFEIPTGLCYTSSGDILVTDQGTNKIRRINVTTAAVTTIAGNGTAGFADGALSSSMFNLPFAVCTDAFGNIYVGDPDNNRVRKITCTTTTTNTCANITFGTAVKSTCNGITTIKLPTTNTSWNVEYSLDGTTWQSSNWNGNSFEWQLPETQNCVQYWAREVGCTSPVTQGCEIGSAPCSTPNTCAEITFGSSIRSTCNGITTIKLPTTNTSWNVEYSLDGTTWQPSNWNGNSFEWQIPETQDCVPFWAREVGCTSPVTQGCKTGSAPCLDPPTNGIETTSLTNVSISPNPMENEFMIKSDFDFHNAKCDIYDLSGKQIYSTLISGKEIVISLKNYNSGTYFLKITSENRAEQFRIIKK